MLSLLSLPITWLAFYGVGRTLDSFSLKTHHYTIVFASVVLLFAATGTATSALYVGLACGILCGGHLLSLIRDSQFRKITFFLQIAAIILMIFVFLKWRVYFQKYFVYLPSLSYLGFRGISYLCTVRKEHAVNFSAGLMQMLFFPMLLMGPISRVENFAQRYFNYHEVLYRLMQGLAMLIAAHLCQQYVIDKPKLAVNVHWLNFWLGAVANSLDLYFSFAGYSHLIIGLGILAGFKLPENFNNPYLATSISDFWRRWHMSLSYWIRDYVYIPLGGNRKGIIRKCCNVIIAMALVGIWHGLESHYLLWGLFHGTLLAGECLAKHFQIRLPLLSRSRPLKITTTFILITFGWLMFKYSVADVLIYLKRMIPNA